MNTILIGAAVAWCIGFAVIGVLSYRKHQRRAKIDRIRRAVQSGAEQERREA